MDSVISRLEAGVEGKRTQFQEGFDAFAARHGLTDWEGWFNPYDEETYDLVLQNIDEHDTVIEIGAGDLRLALQLSERARRVYAVEVNPLLISAALQAIGFDLPRNLLAICANALDIAFPNDITVAVLLMRHCQHFRLYVDKLRAAGCQRLLTNARWKSGVESMDLTRSGIPFEEVREGWYACRCGAVGYAGQGEHSDSPPVEVIDCPACRPVYN
ncbi:MAG: rRNA adenine N-6-methyltransferase family protein [Anaerolineae bacterium]